MLTATTTHTHADGHNHHLRLSLTLVFSLFNRTARQCFPSLSQSDDRGLLRMNSGIDVSLSFSPLHSPSSSSSSSSLSPSSLVVNSTSNGTFLHRQRSTSPTDSSSAQLQVDFARSVSGEDSKIFPVATSSIVISSSDSDVAATDRIQERHLEDVAVTDNYHSSHKLAHRHSVLETPPLSSSLADRRMPTGNGHRLRWQSSSGRVEESSCSLEFEEEEEGLGDHFCKIKNLDNGKEFIVNECREDGMWNKLREVQTGRQLTMEEFEITVGHSPIVQELMRRESVESSGKIGSPEFAISNAGLKQKKKGGWLKSLKVVANTVVTGHKERSSDEKDTSSERGGRRSSSATDDSQDVVFFSPKRTKVRYYGKSHKEFTALYMTQEIQAHNGSIWTMKFSLDGRYLASAGEDCVIHIWQVMEVERKGDIFTEKVEEGNTTPNFIGNSSPEPTLVPSYLENNLEKKRRGKAYGNKKHSNSDHVVLPDTIFMLSEKPVCSFRGHLEDVLDLSWSKSQHLLSSSMDKTVRLWHMSSNCCLKIFSHSDYVTCIQFNPVDDRYFISGSLDAKVRIWSIPDRQVVDWSDLHEMVTAACYTPDGKCAFVGSHRGSCRIYKTSGNKLQQEKQIAMLDKKKKSQGKKITGFQFPPGNSSEVLITSADSRIRIFDGVGLVHKFKGFRNMSSQIAASFAANGKFVICASEDSYVYIWRHELDCSSPAASSRSKSITRSYENFFCRDVSLAIPWPGNQLTNTSVGETTRENGGTLLSFKSRAAPSLPLLHIPPRLPATSFQGGLRSPMQRIYDQEGLLVIGNRGSPLPSPHNSGSSSNFLGDRGTATWPEEKLKAYDNKQEGSALPSSRLSEGASIDKVMTSRPNAAAWGLAIVTASLGGEIRTFQNFGLPIQI